MIHYNRWGDGFIDVSPPVYDLSSTGATEAIPNLTPFSVVTVSCIWSTVVGAFNAQIQTSPDGTNWENIAGALFTSSGASGIQSIDISDLATNQIRVNITSAATSGSLSVRVVGNSSSTKYSVQGR